MRFFIIAVVWLFASLSALPSIADKFTDGMPLYTRVATECGKDPSKPSFPESVYVSALAEAGQARKDAEKLTNAKSQIAAVEAIIAKLNECRKEEQSKISIPPITSCWDFITYYRMFSSKTATLITTGKMTKAERDRLRETFRKPAQDCIQKQMSTCLDPTDTEKVDEVIESFRTAAEFGFIYTTDGLDSIDRLIARTSPYNTSLKLCTDTDYTCKGDPDACFRRIENLQSILQAYTR